MGTKQILTGKIALGFVKRIEALNRQIDEVYVEVAQYDGLNNDSLIREIVHARRTASNEAENASALLGSLDFDDDGNRIAEPATELKDEPFLAAWPVISARLRQQITERPPIGADRILKQIEMIDRLHEMTVERGIPVVSLADFERVLGTA